MRKINLIRQKSSFDRSLLALVLFLVFVGLVAVADASAPQSLNMFGSKFYLLKQQLIWAIVGGAVLFVVSRVNYKFWEKVATPFFFICLVPLVVVLLPNLGFKALGARRWIDTGFFNFQPSELIKLALVMYLAKVAAKKKNALSYFIPLVVVTGLVMLQPDLGTTMVITILGLSQIFVSEIRFIYFSGAFLIGTLATIGLILVSPYRKERLLTFLQMEKDPLGSSYHIRQILLGLGSGGVFGMGLGSSRQKYLFLPEASTDSIFAIIAEELGLVGAILLILLFVFFIYKGLVIALKAPDIFSKVLATGIVGWIGGQAFLNMASMVALVPLTGIPLPFISYGGSSLVTILFACGILLNISKYAKEHAKHT